MLIKEAMLEMYSDMEWVTADGFDDAIIGVCENRVVYSVHKCIKILMNDMSFDDAVEYFNFNVSGSYIGEQTPIWVDDLFYQEV
jgi:hypothetical protein